MLAKNTDRDREILRRLALGERNIDIAKSLGVTRCVVAGVKFNAAHPAEKSGMQCGALRHNAKLNDIQVAEIRERRAAGELLRVLSAEYGVSMADISNICLFRVWKKPTPTVWHGRLRQRQREARATS